MNGCEEAREYGAIFTRIYAAGDMCSGFLSCLYGSEPYIDSKHQFLSFLICLFGSERRFNLRPTAWSFLSCLPGSERSAN